METIVVSRSVLLPRDTRILETRLLVLDFRNVEEAGAADEMPIVRATRLDSASLPSCLRSDHDHSFCKAADAFSAEVVTTAIKRHVEGSRRHAIDRISSLRISICTHDTRD